MLFGPHAANGAFAIIAGILIIAKGEAWFGRTLPPTVIVKGPVTVLIGTVAIGLGLFIMIAP
jgi:hypothetical protein